jgi:hypothetical protein
MTGAFNVEWSLDALDDWRRLPLAEATAVATAVQSFAQGGPATVIAGDRGTFLLLVGELVVVLLLDGDTLYVWRVRHA